MAVLGRTVVPGSAQQDAAGGRFSDSVEAADEVSAPSQ
jgi:hypothetical protein